LAADVAGAHHKQGELREALQWFMMAMMAVTNVCNHMMAMMAVTTVCNHMMAMMAMMAVTTVCKGSGWL
jgi:hypothetical protein